jgi:hypothetical protein
VVNLADLQLQMRLPRLKVKIVGRYSFTNNKSHTTSWIVRQGIEDMTRLCKAIPNVLVNLDGSSNKDGVGGNWSFCGLTNKT